VKTLLTTSLILISGQAAMAMSCDTGWSCKSVSGKYEIEVQRCRYSNSIGNLQFVKMIGKIIANSEITASYDSKSIGGNILAIEVKIPDTKNDARYLAFESSGKNGVVSERIQESNPGPQSVISSEPISCEEVE
jgi:hypothetical protein